MSGDNVSKVLDLEGALEAGGEEAAEGSDDGGKQGHEESVQQERVQGHGLLINQSVDDYFLLHFISNY